MIKQNIEDLKPTLKKTGFPTAVIIETTGYCNLDCVMCPQGSIKRKRGNMEMAVFKKIVDEIAAEAPETQMWFAIMGEPLFYSRQFLDLVKYAKSKNLKNLNLNTNACLMTADIADEILTCGFNKIIFGIDAVTSETYSKIRRKGDYETVKKNIEYIIDAKKRACLQMPELVMQFIVMDENQHETEAFKKYWLAKGQTVKIRPKLGWGKGVIADNLVIPEAERTFPCPWLVRTMSIHWNGNVAQCDADYEGTYNVGRIQEHTIKELWNGPLKERREKHWNHIFNFLPCSECKDWQAGLSYIYRPDDNEKKGA
jgi:radical SAM protein with 4Fe4S-binding SPASM domain